jgi:hypothetical protein
MAMVLLTRSRCTSRTSTRRCCPQRLVAEEAEAIAVGVAVLGVPEKPPLLEFTLKVIDDGAAGNRLRNVTPPPPSDACASR